MRHTPSCLALAAGILLIQSCATGYNTALFSTKSNIGIDVDTKPPTAEISIARREGVIAPAFEGGQTPPVIASFQSDSNLFGRFFFGVKSTFAGGDAAIALVKEPAEEPYNSMLCLTQKPDVISSQGVDTSVPGKGAVEPFTFDTDTTLGLKLGWSGTTSPFPDTVRLGFNRKELAWAPLFGTDTVVCTIPGTDKPGKPGVYAVWMPSFLGVLNGSTQAGGFAQGGESAQTGVVWTQYIATGKAATMLASRDQIRRLMMGQAKQAIMAAQVGTFDGDDPTVPCIDKWLEADDNHPSELQRWWTMRGLPGFGVLLITSKEHKAQRTAFIAEKRISCTSNNL